MAWKISIRVAALRPETGRARHAPPPRVQHPEAHCSKRCGGQRPHSAAENDHAA